MSQTAQTYFGLGLPMGRAASAHPSVAATPPGSQSSHLDRVWPLRATIPGPVEVIELEKDLHPPKSTFLLPVYHHQKIQQKQIFIKMDISRTLELLNVLYPSPDTPAHALPNQSQQTEAHKALYDFMAEPSAWSLASEILDSLGTHEWAQVSFCSGSFFFS
jgi:hypothetical protein